MNTMIGGLPAAKPGVTITGAVAAAIIRVRSFRLTVTPSHLNIGRLRLRDSGLPRAILSRIYRKLSGCGTHIEHIVSVHDLFRWVVPKGYSQGLGIERHSNRGTARDA